MPPSCLRQRPYSSRQGSEGSYSSAADRSAIWCPLVLAGLGLRVAQPRVAAARLVRWLIRLGIGSRARVSEISLDAMELEELEPITDQA